MKNIIQIFCHFIFFLENTLSEHDEHMLGVVMYIANDRELLINYNTCTIWKPDKKLSVASLATVVREMWLAGTRCGHCGNVRGCWPASP